MRPLRSDAGQTAAEYMGMLLVTAAIIGVIAQTDLPGRLRYELVRTVCLTLNEERACDPPYEVERRRTHERRTLLARAASRRDRDRAASDDEHGRRKIYDARRGRRLRDTVARRNGDRASSSREVNLAFGNLGKVYDYWKATFGRDSYDGHGAPLIATTNYRPKPAERFRNAYWYPPAKQFVFGEGYAAALDVTAHEAAHALINFETRTTHSSGENGALMEAIADMFASNLDLNWTIGEHAPGGALRDMARPSRIPYEDPVTHRRYTPGDTTREYVAVGDDVDGGGRHINAGIPNRAYVNLVEALGRDASQHILYDAVTKYLRRGDGFEAFRSSCLRAATPEQREAVDEAFRKVGLDGTWKAPKP